MRLLLQRGPERQLTEAFIDFVYQPIKDRSGTVSGIFVEGFDVTSRALAENALREMNETLEVRIAQATAELRGALTQLQAEVQERERVQDALRQAQEMEGVGQLTGGIAHDFNNLLTVIMGGLERVQRSAPKDNERLHRAVDGAFEGVRRAATLTHRLLAFSRTQPLNPQPTDVNRLVTETTTLLHGTLGETIELETVLAPRVWAIDIDRNQLENALLNLAVNARDAMPHGGKLTVETANTYLDDAYTANSPELAAGQYVSISISDTGCGIPADIVDRVFEPFFTTKETGRGTGLGLSQVYGFVKQSGGHVRIYSEQDHGTTVGLYLPRHYGEHPADQPARADTAPQLSNGEFVRVGGGGREESVAD